MDHIGLIMIILLMIGGRYFVYDSYKGLPDIELKSGNYTSANNSYMRFKILSDGTISDKKFYDMSFLISRNSKDGTKGQIYEFAIQGKDMVSTYYGNNSEELKKIPKEILNSPDETFLVNCAYTFPIPTGEISVGKSHFGIDESLYNKVSQIILVGEKGLPIMYPSKKVEQNQTLDFTLKVSSKYTEKGEFKYFETIQYEVIPTPPDIKEIKKCKIE